MCVLCILTIFHYSSSKRVFSYVFLFLDVMLQKNFMLEMVVNLDEMYPIFCWHKNIRW